jgi:hypothetical protein
MNMADLKKQWISTKEAADILTARSGHKVSQDYVRRLGNTGKITTERIDERTKLYSRADIEKYTVTRRGDGSVRRAVRGKKSEASAA